LRFSGQFIGGWAKGAQLYSRTSSTCQLLIEFSKTYSIGQIYPKIISDSDPVLDQLAMIAALDPRIPHDIRSDQTQRFRPEEARR
jgi:hypothetical protein